MANKLVQSLFSTGPKDSLAAADVYKANGSRNINSVQELSNQAGVNLTSILGQKTGNNQALTGLLVKIAGNVKVDTSILRDRIQGGMSSVKGSFSDLSDSTKSLMTSSLGDGTGSFQVKMGDKIGVVDSTQYSDINSFGSFINDYTGTTDFSVLDQDATASLISGSVVQASNFGIPNAYSSLTNGIEDDGVMCRVVNQTVPSLVANGDIDTLHDMSSSRSGKAMGAIFPNFAGDFARSFQYPMNRGQTKADAFSKLIGTLTNVNPTWNQTPRQKGGDIALNLLTLLGASPDFKAAVAIGISVIPDNDPMKNYALASVYQPTTVEAEVRRWFPRVVLMTPSTATTGDRNKPIDPRVLKTLGKVGGQLLFGNS